MRNFRLLSLPLLLTLAFALAGCGGGTKPGGISESLVAVHVTKASLAEKRLTITVRFGNENISALGFSGANHKLFLNGSYIGKVEKTAPFGIPPVQSVTQDAVVQVENVSLAEDLLTHGEGSSIAYHLETRLTQTIYEDDFSYNLSAQGSTELHLTEPTAAAK